MKQLITISMLIVTSRFTYAEPPKFKSYAELQRERVAAADATYARHKAERDIAEQAAKDKAIADAKARAEEKAHQKELHEKMALAAAAAPKVSVGVTSVAAAGSFY